VLKGIGPSLCGGEKKAVLTHLRLHGLCGEWKALWRGSDTMPEAVVVDRHCHVLRLAKRPEVERKC